MPRKTRRGEELTRKANLARIKEEEERKRRKDASARQAQALQTGLSEPRKRANGDLDFFWIYHFIGARL